MAEASVGGFEFRGRGFRFLSATSSLDSVGGLLVEAVGDGCGLRLVGVPFPGAASPADLPGRAWEPDVDELAIHADVFAEGGLQIRDKQLWVVGGRVACTRFDAGCGVLVVSFQLAVQDDDYGREDEVDGVAYCVAQPRG